MDKGAPEALVGARVTGRPSSSSSASLEGGRGGVHRAGVYECEYWQFYV